MTMENVRRWQWLLMLKHDLLSRHGRLRDVHTASRLQSANRV
jgi:hypothetical protein